MTTTEMILLIDACARVLGAIAKLIGVMRRPR